MDPKENDMDMRVSGRPIWRVMRLVVLLALAFIITHETPVQAGYCNFNGYCDVSMGENEVECTDCPGVVGCETFTCHENLEDCDSYCDGNIQEFWCDFECNMECWCLPPV
jgi:hypothetical protein